jgi:hypothetical protein
MRTRKLLTSPIDDSQNGKLPKINLEHLSYLRPPQKWLFSVHVYHAFHHKFTIKTPRQTTRISQNPLQNTTNSPPEKKYFIAS